MPNVIVVGSINMDVVALTERHPRAGETVKGHELYLLPGGKGANQAVAASRAGAETMMVGRLGSDAFADELVRFLLDEHIDLSAVKRVRGVPTGTALIAVANGENTIVIVPGANDRLTPPDVSGLPVEHGDIVVAQFEVPQATVLAAFESARQVGATTILNAAPASPCIAGLLALTDILVVNETELTTLVGEEIADVLAPEEAIELAGQLRATEGQSVVVTLGAQGAVAVEGAHTIRVEGHVVEAVDSTGAGDCFVGNLAAELGRGTTLAAAMQTANLAASLCVQRVGAGTSMPALDVVVAASTAAVR